MNCDGDEVKNNAAKQAFQRVSRTGDAIEVIVYLKGLTIHASVRASRVNTPYRQHVLES